MTSNLAGVLDITCTYPFSTDIFITTKCDKDQLMMKGKQVQTCTHLSYISQEI